MTYKCETCGFDLWIPVWEDETVALGLYDDDRFPGRCILAVQDHFDHYEDLDPLTRRHFTDLMAAVGTALRSVANAPRINYAVLGNAVPHVHAHIIPRYPATEPTPDRPPWEDPRKKGALPAKRLDELRTSLSSHFRRTGSR